jgi:dUTP pyrophosphatase
MINTNTNELYVAVEKMYPDVELPVYQTTGSAGCDVKAYPPDSDVWTDTKSGQVGFWIGAGQTKLIPTGLKFSVPEGYEMQIRPRSGLSLKTKLRIANSPGTLDSDYRGELKIIMENTSSEEIFVAKGDRIAQLIFAPVLQAVWEVKDKLDETQRGSGGFGSTGKA